MRRVIPTILCLILWAVAGIYALYFLINHASTRGSPFDTWKLTSPGRMELVGTPYYFVTQDGNEFTAYGPGFKTTCYVVSTCKRRINEHIETLKEMGL